MRRALIVFAKLPIPGEVKTRLQPALTPEEAADLYGAFLADSLNAFSALGVQVRLYLSPPADPIPPDLVPASIPVLIQHGAGLGPRMARSFVETFAAGFEGVVIVGTDHPTLPPVFIEQAFAVLEEPRSLCIGPSEDGGFYLLGMNDFYPELFSEMQYSRPDVFEETLHRAAATPAEVTVLPAWYDVDTPETLRRLRDELEDPSIHAPKTRALLERLGAGERRRAWR